MRFLNRPLANLVTPSRLFATLFAIWASSQFSSSAWAEDASVTAPGHDLGVIVSWLVSLACSLLALFFAHKFFKWMMEQDEGSDRMIEIAEYVRQGARAYLNRQYKVVAGFFLIVFILFLIVAFGFGAQS